MVSRGDPEYGTARSGMVGQGRAGVHSTGSCTGLVRSGENGSGEVGSDLVRQGRAGRNEVGVALAWFGEVRSDVALLGKAWLGCQTINSTL